MVEFVKQRYVDLEQQKRRAPFWVFYEATNSPAEMAVDDIKNGAVEYFKCLPCELEKLTTKNKRRKRGTIIKFSLKNGSTPLSRHVQNFHLSLLKAINTILEDGKMIEPKTNASKTADRQTKLTASTIKLVSTSGARPWPRSDRRRQNLDRAIANDSSQRLLGVNDSSC